MKLHIGEKISHYRKLKNMTQEQLASRIGISAQAVSGWERAVGYPDITLLPGLSHVLGVTIDTLLGNDEIGVQEDIRGFYERFWPLDSREQLALATEYYRKYPENYDIADTLVMVLSDWGFAEGPESFALLREACERIMENCTDNAVRYRAVAAMCRWCDDSEADRWLDMNPKLYSYVRGEVLEERLLRKEEYDAMRRQKYKNNVSLMLHAVSKQADHRGNPDIAIGHNGYLRRLIHTFGENGEVPDGWLCKYAFITMRYAAGLFGAGRTEEGFRYFTEAMEAYQKHFALPDNVPLSLGAPAFFGDITVKKYTVSGHCDSYSVDMEASSYYMQNPPFLYTLLTCQTGWEWFNGVREDPRFRKAVEEAKTAAETWRKMREE